MQELQVVGLIAFGTVFGAFLNSLYRAARIQQLKRAFMEELENIASNRATRMQ